MAGADPGQERLDLPSPHGVLAIPASFPAWVAGAFPPLSWQPRHAPSLGSGIDIRIKEIDYAALRRLVGQWRQILRCSGTRGQ